jgi:hypothetical protein
LEGDKSRHHQETTAQKNSLEELTEDSIEVTDDFIEVMLKGTQA